MLRVALAQVGQRVHRAAGAALLGDLLSTRLVFIQPEVSSHSSSHIRTRCSKATSALPKGCRIGGHQPHLVHALRGVDVVGRHQVADVRRIERASEERDLQGHPHFTDSFVPRPSASTCGSSTTLPVQPEGREAQVAIHLLQQRRTSAPRRRPAGPA